MNSARPNPLDSLAAEYRHNNLGPMDGQAVNPEAERAVIAALMRNPDSKELIRLGITVDLFALDATREAFRAITALIADDVTPDAATLSRAVSPATKIEIETSLLAHASAANLPTYVSLLKTCLHERKIQAARDRLVKAAAAGAPDHELQAILESIRQAGQCNAGKGRFVSVGELCALPPTENWLMKGYLTLDSLAVLFGDPGCGKSFIAIDLACHVATGRPWRGCSVKQGKVLYIAGEGRNGLSKRFKAWFERHGETPRNLQICTSPIALTDPVAVAALVAEIKMMPDPPVLIVVDTINRNFGPGDENTTADMTKAVAGLDALRNATGAALLAVHHSGHGDKSRGRGSSVLRASVDVEYAAEKFDRTVQVRCTKAKDFDHPAPLAWTLEKQSLPWADADGAPLDSAVLIPGDLHEPPPPPNSSRMGANQSQALRLLNELHRSARSNLESSGHDPETARVSRAEWYRAMKEMGFPSSRRTEFKKDLLKRGLISESGDFVAPVAPATEFATEFATEQLRNTESGTCRAATLRYGGSIETRSNVAPVAPVVPSVPDFVPDLYRTVPESAKASCTVPYRGTYKVPGRAVHEAGTDGRGTDYESQPASSLSADADALANVLKLYRGWATLEELTKKSGLGSQGRVMVAAQELSGKGLALMERGMVKPVGVEVRP